MFDKMNKEEIGFKLEQFMEAMDGIPICINMLNEKADSIYCNSYTVDLYGCKTKNEYMERFYELTPENQPDGKNSKLSFRDHVLQALHDGEAHFNWMDINADDEELPLYISIYRLNAIDENGDRMLVSTMQDLRPHLVSDEVETEFDGYYYNRMTYKDLFNTVAELTDEWFWVYDVKLSTIQFYGKGREILGLSAEKQAFPDYVVSSGMVYPDDLDTFLKFDENLRNGVVEPVEVRFVQPSGSSRFYKIIYKTMFDKHGKPLFSVGKTFDIDKQKRLEVLSKTDLLTNCLNKITTENSVRDIIENSPKSFHALFIIDVDDFKSVNDELGHYFGDIVLCDIAKNLHANFRGADIIGRIGGDEFLVFVKDISDERVIKSKAKAIAEAFKSSYAGKNNEHKVSGSIGVSLYPQHAKDYEGLYKCADKALYNSKASGKDRYTIYSDELAETDTKKLTAVDNTNKSGSTFYDSSITSTAFDVMYQADSVSESMNVVLKLVGMQMNANRCYVAQTLDNGKSYSISYEWTAEGVSPKIDEHQNVYIESLKSHFKVLETEGIIYNNHLSSENLDAKSDAIDFDFSKSYLMARVKGKRNTGLVFGVDDNSKNRVWSEKEINTIQYLVKMISIFMASANIKDE